MLGGDMHAHACAVHAHASTGAASELRTGASSGGSIGNLSGIVPQSCAIIQPLRMDVQGDVDVLRRSAAGAPQVPAVAAYVPPGAKASAVTASAGASLGGGSSGAALPTLHARSVKVGLLH